MFVVALAGVCAGGCYRPVTEWGPRCAFSDCRVFANYTPKLCATELFGVFYYLAGPSAA